LNTFSGQSCLETIRFEPGSYLEIFPWSELRPIDCPEAFQISCNLTPLKSNPVMWMEWIRPLACDQFYEHHIFTEEEVYQYHLSHKSTSVGHLINNQVVFGLYPLEETNFLSDMRTFWTFWVRQHSAKRMMILE